ncbi:conserved hypothetical protein [Frankia canadensis]|uniref:DUF7919 domain-containing protein n=1 Tax=Frankia canadensis TaxID=1836972 RepID=A0A2I2KV35_9ACTN|nr:hypothetical protein [Frankia canadensis]SNQ49515.1 conserved hypothetical protein [Frankia canadensis]SOU56805.1 conserved hypothetical protein [Frankia canadensis]
MEGYSVPYLPDLTPYPNLEDMSRNFGWPPPGTSALTVGWLAPEHNFPTAFPESSFLDSLFYLCAHHSILRTRGFHSCALPHTAKPAAPYPARRGGEEAWLGSAEISVVAADGKLLFAPNLVFHYVEEHHYQPPDIFIEAVLAGRTVVLPTNFLL